MRTCIILILCCLFSLATFGQKDTLDLSRFELGINVSNVLANFFNSDFPRAELEQYTLGLKLLNRQHRSAFRAHIGGSLNSGTTEEPDVFFALMNKTSDVRLKVGWEWHREVVRRFKFIYGLDGLFGFSSSKTSVPFSSSDTETEKFSTDYGTAIFLGFRYEFSKKFLLTTESALNLLVRRRTDYVTENNRRTQVLAEDRFLVRHQLPISLYLYIKI